MRRFKIPHFSKDVMFLFGECDKNEAILCGYLNSVPVKTHTAGGFEYYGISLRVPRLSGREDLLNITAPSYVLPKDGLTLFSKFTIRGVMRSRNQHDSDKYRLILCICAREMQQSEPDAEPANSILLTGAVCKPPIYRETPLGRRVCDIMLAVKRSYGKADFLPLIVWGANADLSKDYKVGDKISCEGRFQSREYIKKTEAGDEVKTAYEVSVSKISRLEGLE